MKHSMRTWCVEFKTGSASLIATLSKLSTAFGQLARRRRQATSQCEKSTFLSGCSVLGCVRIAMHERVAWLLQIKPA